MDEEQALNAGPSGGPSTDEPLSKNQQKKLAKRARFQEQKLEKRVQEKARRRERTKALKEGYAAGTLTEEEKTVLETRRELQRARKAAGKGKEGDVFPGSLVIDLAFDDLMTDGEITSMAGQLAYVYSVNRTAKRPFAGVLFTSFGPEASPRLWTKLRKNNWDKWSRSHFWEEGVDGLAAVLKGEAVAPFTRGEEEDELVASLSGPTLPSTLPPDSQLVYLSADAEEELATLSPNETYVIGGIVDRNRHKMLCQNKAEGLGIRTARLPIGTFIENMPTRKVLTVNQVVEILVQYNAQGDWKAAFETVIPSRKFYLGHAEKTAANKARTREGVDIPNEDAEAPDASMDEEEVANQI